MSSSSENEGAKHKSGYIKLTSRKKFAEWKRKTEALAAQQGYLRFLNNDVQVASEDDLEQEWIDVQNENDPDTRKKLKSRYLKTKSTRKLSTSAACMLIMAVPGTMSKKLESCDNNPYEMYKLICAKYDKKGNNKLSNLCQELEKCKLKNIKMEPDDWFTNLINLNERIEKICQGFGKSEKQLAMHIINNMCSEYKELKLLIENKPNYLDDIEELQVTIQDHWETYHSDMNEDKYDSNDDESEEDEKTKDQALTITEKKNEKKFNREELVCDHCGGKGHTKARCFKLHGYPKHWEDRRTCYICGKTGHIAKNCPTKKNETCKGNEDNAKEDDNSKDDEINSLFIGTIMCEEAKEPDEDEENQVDDEVEPTERVFSVGTIPDDEVIEWMGNTYNTAAPRTNNLGEMMAWVQANEMIRNDQVTLTRVNQDENIDNNDIDREEEQSQTETVNANEVEGENSQEQLNQTPSTNNETKVEDNDDDDETIPNTVNTICLEQHNLSFSDMDTIDSMPSLKPRYEYEDSDSDDDIDNINMIPNYDTDSCASMPSLTHKYDDESSDDDSYDSEDEADEDQVTNNENSTSGNVNILEEKCTYANVVKKLASDEDDTTSKWIKVSKNKKEKTLAAGAIERWLADTGASCHVTGNGAGMSNTTTDGSQTVIVGDGRKNIIKKSGGINLVPEGSTCKLHLKDTKMVPDITKNIISIGMLLQEGGTMHGDKDEIRIKYKGTKFIFNKSPRDGLYYLYASRLHQKKEELELLVYDIESCKEAEQNQSNDKNEKNIERDTKVTKPKMNRTEAHEKWGHQYKDGCDLMAKYMGIQLQGKLSCTGCGRVKAREKGVAKKSQRQATRKGERICIDTTGPYPKTGKGTKYWMCALDDYTDMSWLHFAKSKSEMSKFVSDLIEGFKGKGIKIDYIRCDNAGEHMHKLKDLCRKEGIELEYTAPGSPRQNGRVEKKINLIWQRALTMMVHARLTKEMQSKLWAEAVNCSVFLENLILKANKDKPALEKWTGKSIRSHFNKLVQFGRVGYVAKKATLKAKMNEKGYPAIMVGYAANSSSGTYRLYNPSTKRVIHSRDVKWNEFIAADDNYDPAMFDFEAGIDDRVSSREKELVEKTLPLPVQTKEFDTSDEEENNMPPTTTTPTNRPRRSALRTMRSMAPSTHGMSLRNKQQNLGRRIVTGDTTAQRVTILNHVQAEGEDMNTENEYEWVNLVHDPTQYYNDEVIDRKLMYLPSLTPDNLEHANAIMLELNSLELSSDFNTPTSIKEAINGPEGELWSKSATAEVNNFLKRGSWIIRNKNDIKASGRKLIGVKWVFKKKDEPDGSIRYKSRIVTKGYMQIPGVDYTESFSPVATATALRVGLALTLFNSSNDWTCELVDVEAAFLEGKLKSAVYIDLPKGMVELGFMSSKEFENACAELTGGMYGCVDAALLYFMKFCEWATNPKGMNLAQSKVDPCVFYRKDNEGTLLIIVICHVDDCCMMGRQDIVKETKAKLREGFGTVEDGKLRKLLGVRYDWKTDENNEPYIEMTMNDKAEEIIKSYEKYTGRTPKLYGSPGAPGSTLKKNEGKTIKMTEYRSLVGQTMFYSTKIAPECAYANGQLARHMQNPGEEHWKAMDRFVGYLKSKTDHKLIMRKPEELRTISYCDSSYGDCKDTRKSTMGEVHTLGGAITSWRSQRQKTVSQSSSEAEYVTLSEAAKEQKFTQMLLREIAEVEEPGYIFGDNEASIFLAKNKQVSNRTKHIDIREHFIRECVEEGSIELKKVDTASNKSDIMTKNLPLRNFEENSKDLLEGNIMHEVMTITSGDVNANQRENDSSHISKFGIGFDLDQHRNTPNPTGKKIIEYSVSKSRIQTVNSEIEKVYKQDLQGKDNIHINTIQKNIRAKKVNSCMSCTNKGHYGHTRGLCRAKKQRMERTFYKKEYDHNKEEIWENKKEVNKSAG
jgi:hypothetical protein